MNYYISHKMSTTSPKAFPTEYTEEQANLRDTIPDDMELLPVDDSAANNNIAETTNAENPFRDEDEPSGVRLKIASILKLTSQWYESEIPILDREEMSLRFRIRIFELINDAFFEPAFAHLKAKTPEYPIQYADRFRNDALRYLLQLREPTYHLLISPAQVHSLQKLVLEGNWRTELGLIDMKTKLIEELGRSETLAVINKDNK